MCNNKMVSIIYGINNTGCVFNEKSEPEDGTRHEQGASYHEVISRDIPAFGDPSILSRQRRSTAVKNKCKGSEIDTKVSMKRKLVVYFTI